jgi:hypothetical protein
LKRRLSTLAKENVELPNIQDAVKKAEQSTEKSLVELHQTKRGRKRKRDGTYSHSII